ncbi:tRNA lysidine(34) synthetase TilS [Prosthecomicrobium pneumaticum]|uniref:tRNA(Ile)-lysidine synthase n=1 Tax=Prosthecomicrobium pneumaticum TaxID=81895 RepID=A0A7W9CVS6_9HYPH|nr:tRNA(Ile)-lysidine synthase [Prosthecomicrobium pneumaticum]
MRAADHRPIDDATLAALFAPLAGHRRLALAVSGGPDSLALLVLVDRWARSGAAPADLLVLTVDHALRAGSAAEAAAVAAFAARLGRACRVLVRRGPAPTADIEAAARAARYRLLADAARADGAEALVTAHHRDDQAETFLLRLARGSGVYGLAAMRPESLHNGLPLLRPLLDLPRARLRTALDGVTLPPGLPVEDPHNTDPRFARARLRALMPRLAAEGFDAARLAATAQALGRAADALEAVADRLIAGHVAVDFAAAVALDAAAWAEAPDEIGLRVLARILRAAGGGAVVPRLDRLERLDAAMRAALAGAPLSRTLAGLHVEHGNGVFRFSREAGRAGLSTQPVAGRCELVWDGRFAMAIDVPEGLAGPTLGPLGPDGRRALAGLLPAAPRRAIETLPTLRLRERILAVGGLGVLAGGETAAFAFEARPIVAARLAERPPETGV